MEFRGVLETARGGGAIVRLPAEATESFGTRRAVRVRGTFAGVAYRSTLMPLGGGAFALGVHKATREAANVAIGDEATVVVERDDEPREVAVPAELSAALAADAAAAEAFERLAPSHRREHANHVAEAKKPETRQRRAERVVEMLRGDDRYQR